MKHTQTHHPHRHREGTHATNVLNPLPRPRPPPPLTRGAMASKRSGGWLPPNAPHPAPRPPNYKLYHDRDSSKEYASNVQEIRFSVHAYQ